jgi:hypothetical protein
MAYRTKFGLFNLRNDGLHVLGLFFYEAKGPNLELKTWAKKLQVPLHLILCSPAPPNGRMF